MPGWSLLTGLEHEPQGYFQLEGPGLVSTSPESNSSQRMGDNSGDEGDNIVERCKKRLCKCNELTGLHINADWCESDGVGMVCRMEIAGWVSERGRADAN